MAGVYTYNPKLFQMVFAGKLIQGFAADSFITISRNADMWQLAVGADSISTRVKSSNFSGRVTVNLHQSSPSNDDLQALATADETSDSGRGPLYLKDGSGRTVATAVDAWIVKVPDAEFGTSVSNRQWVLEAGELTVVIGGN